MARPHLVLLALVLLLASACGDDDAVDDTTATPATAAEDDGDGGGSEGDERAGEIDCDALADVHFTVLDTAQILASLVSNDQFELVAEGVVDVDFDEINAAIEGLRPLEGVENPLGSVEESLDRLRRVASLAAAAARDPDPESTPEFAEIQPLIDDGAMFLAALGPVNYAFGETCMT